MAPGHGMHDAAAILRGIEGRMSGGGEISTEELNKAIWQATGHKPGRLDLLPGAPASWDRTSDDRYDLRDGEISRDEQESMNRHSEEQTKREQQQLAEERGFARRREETEKRLETMGIDTAHRYAAHHDLVFLPVWRMLADLFKEGYRVGHEEGYGEAQKEEAARRVAREHDHSALDPRSAGYKPGVPF